MSDFSVQRSQSMPNIKVSLKPSESQEPAVSKEQPVKSGESQVRENNHTQSLIKQDPLQEETTQKIADGIEDVGAKNLQKNVEVVPRVSELKEVQGQVSFETAQKQVQQNAGKIPGTQLHLLFNQDVHQALETLKPQVQENGLKAMTELSHIFETPGLKSGLLVQQLQQFMQTEISETVHELDRSVFKKGIYENANDKAIRFISRLANENPEACLLLSKSSTEELQEILARQMGLLKDKYQGAGFADLSESKQKLVNHLIEGFQDISGNPSNQSFLSDFQSDYLKHIQTEIHTALASGNANSNLSLALKGLDHQQVQQFALTQLRNRTDLPEKLKNEIAQAMVKGFESGLQAQKPGDKESLAEGFSALTRIAKNSLESLTDKDSLTKDVLMLSPQVLKQQLSQVLGLTPHQSACLEPLTLGLYQGVPNQASVEETQLKSAVSAPLRFQLNGKTYAEPKFLTSGGFAHIIRYTEVDSDPPRYVVMKKPQLLGTPEQTAQANAETRKEAAVLQKIGHADDVIRLEGVVMSPRRELLMVLEYAPGGDGHGLASRKEKDNKLDLLLKDQVINQPTAELLRTLMARDGLQALATLHSKDLLSLDYKLPNMLLGLDGVLKISDFGLSQQMGQGKTQISTEFLEANQTPDYKAPELFFFKLENVQKINALIYERFGVKPLLDPPARPGPNASLEEVKQYDEDVNKYLKELRTPPSKPQPKDENGEVSEQELTTYRKALKQHQEYTELYQSVEKEFVQLQKGSQISTKMESWNAGILINELFYGTLPVLEGVSTKFNIVREHILMRFSLNPQNRMWVPADSPVKELINQLMHPDPNQRISLQEALKHPVFQNDLLARPESRMLMQELFCKEERDPLLVNLHVTSMGLAN